MCEPQGILLYVDRQYVNGVLVYKALFGFEDTAGNISALPVNLYMYNVKDASISEDNLIAEAFMYTHNMKYHCPMSTWS